MGRCTTEDANARSLGGGPTTGRFVSLASVRGIAGAACLGAWVLVVLFMGRKFALPSYSSLPIGSIQVAAFGGLTVALLLLLLVARRSGRGPEPSHAVVSALAWVPLLLIFAVSVATGAHPGLTPLALVAWALSGASAAYGLRRSLALMEAFACGMPDCRALRICAGAVGCSSMAGALVSRMDPPAALAVTFILVPLALTLLPQGRLSVAPRTEESLELSRAARSHPPRRMAALTVCLAAVGLVFGFQTSVGDVLYSETDWTPTIVYIVLLASAVIVGLAIARLTPRAWLLVTQGLCAFGVVAMAPMLFLAYDPHNVLWTICQDSLLLGTACCYGVLAFAVSRGGFGVPRETDGTPGLVAATLFLGTLVGGRLLGTALADTWGPESAPFEVTVLGLASLLLACVFVLGWGGEDATIAPVNGVPASAPVAAEEPSGEVAASAVLEVPAGRHAALVARCNEVAWRNGLSEREHDVLILLARGLNAQQVAERMVVSRNTVKSHMAHIYAKLGIHTRAELDALLGLAPTGPFGGYATDSRETDGL